MTDMGGLLQYALIAFSSIFVIVDPFAAAPLFVTMTANDPADKQKQMAWRASLMAFIALTVFAILGDTILRLFSITIGAFRIAGGIILFGIGMNMLRVRMSREVQTPEEIREGTEKEDVALIPLAFPMLSGPGAISTVLVLTQQTRGIAFLITLLLAIFVTCGLSYVILRHAARITSGLGRTGLGILSRLMGLLLTVIAIQFILNGLEEAGTQMVGAWLSQKDRL